MKAISKIFGLMLIIAIAFSSCSSDDDGPKPTEKSGEFTYTYLIPVEGIMNSQQKPEKVTLQLDKLLGDHTKNFLSGEFQRGKCSIEINGLSGVSSTATLKDFTITVGNRGAINLGNCNPSGSGANSFQSDYIHNSDKYTDIVKYVFDDIVSKQRSSNVGISFTPTETITSDKNKVFLKITVTGLMKYNVYENQ